ncbi:hypothetical protein B566_EDAN002790 [Ephemera danica]|nr:hypothetical protein B566_EDAN002790 [Ephemera danica]
MQTVSVSVGVWTLVAISLERYFAICRPLKSRRWQTRFHAYKMIGIVWLGSLVWNLPILVVSKLKAMREKEVAGRERERALTPPGYVVKRARGGFLDDYKSAPPHYCFSDVTSPNPPVKYI